MHSPAMRFVARQPGTRRTIRIGASNNGKVAVIDTRPSIAYKVVAEEFET